MTAYRAAWGKLVWLFSLHPAVLRQNPRVAERDKMKAFAVTAGPRLLHPWLASLPGSFIAYLFLNDREESLDCSANLNLIARVLDLVHDCEPLSAWPIPCSSECF